MYCHVHQKTNNKAPRNKTTKHQKQKPTHTKSNHQHKPPSSDVTVPVYGWKRSIEARGDSLVSSRRMQMTTCVPCWRRPIEINNNKTNLKITMGHFSGCRKQRSSMRKPGIPPARIPEIRNYTRSNEFELHLLSWVYFNTCPCFPEQTL